MDERQQAYLNMALEYKKKYKECSWWKFKKRRYLKSMWKSGLDLIITRC